MSRKARRGSRLALNRALAQKDAEHRCGSCRRLLPHGYLVLIGAAGTLRFCDEECRLDAAGERDTMARRTIR